MIALVTSTAALLAAVMALALVALATVGSRCEDRAGSLPTRPRGLLALIARRILRLHIRRPAPTSPNPSAASQPAPNGSEPA